MWKKIMDLFRLNPEEEQESHQMEEADHEHRHIGAKYLGFFCLFTSIFSFYIFADSAFMATACLVGGLVYLLVGGLCLFIGYDKT